MSNADDTLTFDDKTEFDNFTGNFTDIVDAGGTDTISFGSTAISGDLDFTKLAEFENLNLSSVADDVTLSGDEPSNVNALGGDDNFTIDFGNVANFNSTNGIDGGTGTNKVTLTGSASVTTDGDDFLDGINYFEGISELDLTALNGGAGFSDDNAVEFEFTNSMLEDWIGTADGDLKLTLTNEQAEDIMFTDNNGVEHNTTSLGSANINDGTYDLDSNTTLTINITDN
jgi:hypothetical protein